MKLKGLGLGTSNSKERRYRQRFEIFCILFVFMFVMNLFSTSLWPLLSSSQLPKTEVSEVSKESSSKDIPPAETVRFDVDKQGNIFTNGKKVTGEQIEQVFESKEKPAVEVIFASRQVVQIFHECYQSGIAPNVKLVSGKL